MLRNKARQTGWTRLPRVVPLPPRPRHLPVRQAHAPRPDRTCARKLTERDVPTEGPSSWGGGTCSPSPSGGPSHPRHVCHRGKFVTVALHSERKGSGRCVPSGLADGRQAVWSHLMIWIMDVTRPGYMSPPRGNWKIIWRSGLRHMTN